MCIFQIYYLIQQFILNYFFIHDYFVVIQNQYFLYKIVKMNEVQVYVSYSLHLPICLRKGKKMVKRKLKIWKRRWTSWKKNGFGGEQSLRMILASHKLFKLLRKILHIVTSIQLSAYTFLKLHQQIVSSNF